MRVIAIVNQKGGCGKTTTTINLAGCLAIQGSRVLVLDLDPQAHATLGLGVDPESVEESLYEVLAEPGGTDSLPRVIVEAQPGLEVAPSGIVLSALEQKLALERVESRTERLANALETVHGRYDYVLIDCPPNVGLLTFNALRAASEVIVPLETSPFAIHGVTKLLETIALLSERIGHDLTVRVLPTLFDGRTRYAQKILSEIREMFKDMCFDSVIRVNVKLREAIARGMPLVYFARRTNGAVDYAALALEVASLDPALAETSLAESFEEPGDVPREVVIRFRDPDASDVRIAGDFNGWVPDRGVRSLMESEGSTRTWTKVLNLAPGTYQYRYVIDGEWREDPENPEVAETSLGGKNSILVVR
ncbi:AAA family ATPase [Myxococcota bacterium]|nr:AAA family ATPase [Myxococcota bacterium]